MQHQKTKKQYCVEDHYTDKYVTTCHFCHCTVCVDHIHFLPVEDLSLYGEYHDAIEVCSGCMPSLVRTRNKRSTDLKTAL